MTKPETHSRADARRERNSEANHLGMDTVASGMAAAGLGLALLHQDMAKAEAPTGDARRPESHTLSAADQARQTQAQPEHGPEHMAAGNHVEAMQTAAAPAMSPAADAGTGVSVQPAGAIDHEQGPIAMPEEASVGQGGLVASGHGTPSVTQNDGGESLSSGLQNLLSHASSAAMGVSHGLEQKLDAAVTTATDAIGASLNAVTSQISSLTSQIGDLVTSRAADAVGQATDLVDHLTESGPAPAQAVVDPIFHDAFGPASDIHALASDVVDTSGLASFGSSALDMPIAFLGQSYTDVADQTVHGLQGLTHGLV